MTQQEKRGTITIDLLGSETEEDNIFISFEESNDNTYSSSQSTSQSKTDLNSTYSRQPVLPEPSLQLVITEKNNVKRKQ